MARYSLNSDQLSPLAREAAAEAGLGARCRNPFKSIIVRAVEILYALDEALRLIGAYEPPDPPPSSSSPAPRPAAGGARRRAACSGTATGCGADGSIAEARIVPPTSQNQGRIEQDLREFVAPRVRPG